MDYIYDGYMTFFGL